MVPTISGSFLVAAFRRPDFRVDATLSADPAVLGATVRGTVDAKYLFGAALSARPVRWGLRREPVLNVPDAIRERYPESQFAVGYLPADGYGPRDVSYEDKTEALDQAGRLNISLPTTSDLDFAQSYLFESDVEGPSGQHIASRAVARCPPGVALHRDVAGADLPRPEGWRERHRRCRGFVRAAGERHRRDRVPSSRAVDRPRPPTRRRLDAPRDSGRGVERPHIRPRAAPLPIAISDGGRYILRAVASDAAGRRTRTEQRFYALGPGVSSWTSSGNRIILTPERETWKPGETARILIDSPWPSATALVTVEREGIRSHRSFAVTSMQDAVEVPVTEADVPNVYVSVLLVKGGRPTTRGRWHRRTAFVPCRLRRAHRRRFVEAFARGHRSGPRGYRPRQPVRVAVAVATPEKLPARAEVTLWAMDHGLLSLTAYKTPDILKQIYSPKALQVMTTDSRQRLMSRRPVAPPSNDDNVINTSTSSRGGAPSNT